ncbi:hypothetical protein NXY56_006470 [Leishmania guyanensis]
MCIESTSLPPPFPSDADLLACIASYWPAAEHRNGSSGVRREQRLPLAWIAASPAARVVAEQRHAWAVLPFTQIGTRPANAEADGAASHGVENTFGAALANATVQPRVLQVALKTHGTDASANGHAASSSQQTARGRVVARVLRWLRRAAEGFADIDHASSSVSSASPSFNGPASPPSMSLRTTNGSSSNSSSAARGVTGTVDAARCCGVHIGGLTVVLVSGVHELGAADAGATLPQDTASSDRAAERKGAPPMHGEGEAVEPSSQLLFPSTTSCGGSAASVLSVPPNAAVYNGITRGCGEERMPSTGNSVFRAGAKLHGHDGGADDEAANDPKTATSVYVVQLFSELRSQVYGAKRRRGPAADVSSRQLLSRVWYRQVFVGTAEATDEVLCGVSQWWLQRSVRRLELPTTTPRVPNLTQRNRRAHASRRCKGPRTLPPPSLHIKYVTDVFVDLWWPRRFILVVQHRFAERTAHVARVAKLLLLMWVICVTFMEVLLHGLPQVTPSFCASDDQHSDSRNNTSHRRSVLPADLISTFYKMGRIYGRHQMRALDVSHTGVCGTHLLACVLGSMMAPTIAGDGKAVAVDCKGLWALDVAGCTQLRHQRGELYALSDMLDELYHHAASRAAAFSLSEPSGTLAVVDLLLSLSLRNGVRPACQSATGLALALFTHHGHLTWVCGAGSSLDNAALRELGQYALLVEAVAVTQQSQPAPTCVLRALDLTSVLNVDNVNPMGYVTQLEQLLLPFTYVDDAGIGCLDGHAYVHDLSAIVSLFTAVRVSEATGLPDSAQKSLQRALGALESLILIDDNSAGRAKGHGRNSRQDIVETLHQKFRSHLYHLDFTFCLCVSSVNGLAHQQRLELLNLSQTRVNKVGLFGGADTHHLNHSTRSPVPAAQPRCTPPLRLFIAEMCEHLSDLSGLAHINTLECVIVRSGSLGDDGLRAVCTPDMQRLQLMDLSYCDRLHHVGCLARLPSLETLILDSTDVTPAEVKQLRFSRSLRTLSLRFCTEFAFIGKGLKELEAAVGTFAALERYLYEDLAGDDELRRKNN